MCCLRRILASSKIAQNSFYLFSTSNVKVQFYTLCSVIRRVLYQIQAYISRLVLLLTEKCVQIMYFVIKTDSSFNIFSHFFKQKYRKGKNDNSFQILHVRKI